MTHVCTAGHNVAASAEAGEAVHVAHDLPLSQPMQHIPEGVKGLTFAAPTAGGHRVFDGSLWITGEKRSWADAATEVFDTACCMHSQRSDDAQAGTTPFAVND